MPDPRASFGSGYRSGPVPGTKGTTQGRLQTLDQGSPVSQFTPSWELGHGGANENAIARICDKTCDNGASHCWPNLLSYCSTIERP
jgi:hypothetical protein